VARSLTDQVMAYGSLFDEDAKTPEFKLEALSLRLSHVIAEAMDARGMSRIDLARALGVSAPMVTKILSGRSNFTLRTLVCVADALGCEFDPVLRRRDSSASAELLLSPDRQGDRPLVRSATRPTSPDASWRPHSG